MYSVRNSLGQFGKDPALLTLKKEKLVNLYWEQGLTQKQVAQRLGVARRSLTRKMSELHIPLRSTSERHRTGAFSEEHRKKISQALKGKAFSQEHLRKMRMSRGIRPTKPELMFLQFCRAHNLPFEYVGDGSFWIDRRNPDFLHQTEKIVVEVFGSYWHRNDAPHERIAYYEERGYRCIVIWDYEIQNSDLLRMVQ